MTKFKRIFHYVLWKLEQNVTASNLLRAISSFERHIGIIFLSLYIDWTFLSLPIDICYSSLISADVDNRQRDRAREIQWFFVIYKENDKYTVCVALLSEAQNVWKYRSHDIYRLRVWQVNIKSTDRMLQVCRNSISMPMSNWQMIFILLFYQSKPFIMWLALPRLQRRIVSICFVFQIWEEAVKQILHKNYHFVEQRL